MWSGHVGVSVWKSRHAVAIFLAAQVRVAKRTRRESQRASLKVASSTGVLGEPELAARVRVCGVATHMRGSRGQLRWAGRADCGSGFGFRSHALGAGLNINSC